MINNNIDFTSDRWTLLLTSYFNEKKQLDKSIGRIVNKNNELFLEIDRSFFDQAKILEITKDKAIKKEFSESNLRTISTLFDSVIRNQTVLLNHNLKPLLLSSYSARFSKWAQQHKILACLACILSFGFVYALWCDGNKIHKEAAKASLSIEGLKSCSDVLKNELEAPKVNPKKESLTPEPKPEIASPFEAEFQLIMKTHLNKIKDHLDKQTFQEELNEIENLPKLFANFPSPKNKEDVKQLEKLYLKKCIQILHLIDPDCSKKYRLIREKPFFGLLALDEDARNYQHLSSTLKKDKSICVEAVKRGTSISKIDESCKHDRVVHLANRSLIFAPAHLQNDREFFLESLKICEDPITIPRVFINDRNLVLQAIRKNGDSLQFLTEYERDSEIILAALEQKGSAFEHIPDDLKKNSMYILKAAPTYTRALYHASEEFFQMHMHELTKLLPLNGEILKYCSTQIQNDPHHVAKAVQSKGSSLEFASEALQDNEGLVKKAIQQEGCALQFASDRIRGIREIVIEAIKQNPFAICFSSQNLRLDEELCQLSLNSGKPVFRVFHPQLKSNKKLALLAIKCSRENFKYVSAELKKDREIILAGLKNASYYMWDFLQLHNEEIIFEAINTLDPWVISYASESLKSNPLFVKKILLQYKRDNVVIYQRISPNLKGHPEIVEMVLTHDGLALEHVPDSFKSDKKYALIAVKQNDNAYRFVAESLRADTDIKAAIA